jgi:hypothetical protein
MLGMWSEHISKVLTSQWLTPERFWHDKSHENIWTRNLSDDIAIVATHTLRTDKWQQLSETSAE